MKKKLLGAVLSVAMVATLLAGCGGGASEAAPAAAPAAPAATEEKADDAAPAADAAEEKADDAAADSAAGGAGGLVGVAMPTKDLQRWNQDGSNMEAELKAAGIDDIIAEKQKQLDEFLKNKKFISICNFKIF